MMAKTEARSVILVLASTIITTVSQILLKKGAAGIGTNPLIGLVIIFTGLVLYGIVAVIMIIALKKGEASVLMPIIATSYVWVILSSYIFFNESITALKVSGIFTIIAGLSFIGIGSRKSIQKDGIGKPKKRYA